ncbi:MAG: hypothetical protein AAGJ87_12445, partial [Pseudomonadota bacterium]
SGCGAPNGLSCPAEFGPVFADLRERLLGDPTPQPNTPIIPFENFSAAEQLTQTRALRDALLTHVRRLDEEAAFLERAVKENAQ